MQLLAERSAFRDRSRSSRIVSILHRGVSELVSLNAVVALPEYALHFGLEQFLHLCPGVSVSRCSGIDFRYAPPKRPVREARGMPKAGVDGAWIKVCVEVETIAARVLMERTPMNC